MASNETNSKLRVKRGKEIRLRGEGEKEKKS